MRYETNELKVDDNSHYVKLVDEYNWRIFIEMLNELPFDVTSNSPINIISYYAEKDCKRDDRKILDDIYLSIIVKYFIQMIFRIRMQNQ